MIDAIITQQEYNDPEVIIYRLEEDEFNFYYAKDIESFLIKRVQEHTPEKLVLDMQRVTRVDSSAVGALIRVYAECKRINCAFLILGVHKQIESVFNILNITSIFTLIKNTDEVALYANH